LSELLAKCDPSAPINETAQEWLDAPPVGREMPDENSERFNRIEAKLDRILDAIDSLFALLERRHQDTPR
jgi:hypothetical protein